MLLRVRAMIGAVATAALISCNCGPGVVANDGGAGGGSAAQGGGAAGGQTGGGSAAQGGGAAGGQTGGGSAAQGGGAAGGQAGGGSAAQGGGAAGGQTGGGSAAQGGGAAGGQGGGEAPLQHVHIYIDDQCHTSVDPVGVTAALATGVMLQFHSHSLDYQADVWSSRGYGLLQLETLASWDDPILHCRGPQPFSEYFDVSIAGGATTACPGARFTMTCQ